MKIKGQPDRLGGRAPFVIIATFAGVAVLAIATSWAQSSSNQRGNSGGLSQLGQLDIHLAPSVHWPLAMGNKWTYGSVGAEVTGETQLSVKRISMARGGGVTATLDTDSFSWHMYPEKGALKTEKKPAWDPWTSPIVVKVDDTGIYWVSDQHGTFNPPVPIFKSGTKHGDEWKWSGKIELGGSSWAASAIVSAQSKKVKTPKLAVKEHDALEIMMLLDLVVGSEHIYENQNLSLVPRFGPVTFGYTRQGSGSGNATLAGGTLIEYRVRN